LKAFDEAQLVALVTQGDSRAFAELAQRHLPAIETYARRILADETAAQDIAQETLLVLWQRSGDFKPEKARLTTWLHRVAHNRCIDLLRRQKRETPMPSSDLFERQENSVQGYGAGGAQDSSDFFLSTAPPTLESASNDRAAAIDAALRKLPESQRTALVLTYYQNLSNREVASVMNSSTRAVESLLCRARGNLKKQLENQQ
jgi:RNA polymerase sigma-70 factor (ECF subfamily)